MNKCYEIDYSAPGFAFSSVLRSVKPTKIRSFFSASMLEILDGLELGFSSSEKLTELAVKMLDASEILQNMETRSLVISLLPLKKVQELCKKLGADPGKNPFVKATKLSSLESNLPLVQSFFGVVDDPTAPISQLPGNDLASVKYGLFEHQRWAAERTETMLAEAPHRGVLHMPTGAGKTRTAMHLLAAHLNNNKPTLVIWLAQNIELLDQAADEFQKSWQHLGNRQVGLYRFWGNKQVDLSDARDGLLVAGLSKMTALEKRSFGEVLGLADRTSLIVIDEAHQAIAPTYRSVLDALATKRPLTMLLGLTATPGRTWDDIERDEELSEFFGGHKVMLEVEGHPDPVTYLMKEGYLARPGFRNLNVNAGLELTQEDVSELSAAIDVPNDMLEKLGQNTQRNLKIIASCEELVARHNRIIVFAPSVENARMLAAIMDSRGTEALVVTGETAPRLRERSIQRFKSQASEPIVIFNYGVLTTGFDAPKTSAAIIARPTKSLVLFSQMAGRAMRGQKAGGNAASEIITVIDTQMEGFGDVSEAFVNWEDVWK